MNYHVMTLFPDMINQALDTSILGRAMEKGLITLDTVNIRNFSGNKHNRVDDYPYGGGAGMVIAAGPVYRTYMHVMEKINAENEVNTNKEANANKDVSTDKDANVNEAANRNKEVSANHEQPDKKKPRVVYVTPQGKVFHQKMAEEFAMEDDIIFLCGHYEGIDERALEMVVTDYVSIGDYVLTGGELPVMVMIDAISRLIPGVLNNETSAEFESLQDNLLEYPQYTRPEVFMDKRVPDVLLSGHHANIEKWRREQSIIRTLKNRPDLLPEAVLSKKEKQFLDRLLREDCTR